MPPLVVVCAPLTFPSIPPSLDIPNFGIIQKAWDTLDRIPDAGDALCKFQDSIAMALAPVRRYLEMVEAFATLTLCMESLPKALMYLSPDPIIDCLKNLRKTVLRILSWIPPLSYVRFTCGIASYFIDIIDEIVSFFQAVDDKIDDYVTTFSNANLLGDLDLIQFVNCGMSDLLPTLSMSLDLLKFLAPAMNIMMEVFLRFLPSDQMKQAVQNYQNAGSFFDAASLSIRGGLGFPDVPGFTPPVVPQPPIVTIPRIGGLVMMMNQSRSAMVLLYNLLVRFIGEEPNKVEREMPTFVYI